jgi:predicted DNA-binding transcriptional regulator AlpA
MDKEERSSGRRLLRRSEVIRRTGLSTSTIRRYEISGGFPARVRLGRTTVAYLADEVDNWISTRERVAADGQDIGEASAGAVVGRS